MASPLFLLSISLFPFIIHGAKENHQVIQNTCKTINAYQFADYDFCVSTLQARPARECATLLRIGWTSIELLMSNVTDTRRHIRSVLDSGKVQHWAKRCVTECYERYRTAEILVESCLWKYRHTDFVNANFYAVALINSMVFCEEAFQKGSQGSLPSPVGSCGGGVSPFSARNNNTIQLGSMVQAVTMLLLGELH